LGKEEKDEEVLAIHCRAHREEGEAKGSVLALALG